MGGDEGASAVVDGDVSGFRRKGCEAVIHGVLTFVATRGVSEGGLEVGEVE